jgi:Domain of unknown function (DUF2017)
VALRRIKRSRRGFDLRLPPREREILRTLPDQLRALLDEGDRRDPAVERLFPSAYLDDAAASTDFDDIVRNDLTEDRRRALDEMVRTLDAPSVTEDELLAWLGVVNDLRLVLGVRLAVTEETTRADFSADDEASGSYALYAYLSYLEEEMVEALSSG